MTTSQTKKKRKNNNFYSLEDFVATILRLPLTKEQLKKVHYSWGNTNGNKKGTGTELRFGAIIELKDGKIIYVNGWNDYTGWGCQDGVKMYYDSNWFSSSDGYLSLEPQKVIEAYESFDEYDDFDSVRWDKNPVDLNRWIEGKIQVDETYLR